MKGTLVGKMVLVLLLAVCTVFFAPSALLSPVQASSGSTVPTAPTYALVVAPQEVPGKREGMIVVLSTTTADATYASTGPPASDCHETDDALVSQENNYTQLTKNGITLDGDSTYHPRDVAQNTGPPPQCCGADVHFIGVVPGFGA